MFTILPGGLDTTLLAALIIAYLIYRQFITRPVTRVDFILPLLGAVYIGIRYLNGPDDAARIFVEAAAAVGVASGLLAAGVVHVWRDPQTGVVFQHGGWQYAAILLGLVAFRVVWHLFVDATGISASVTLLNDALIALTLGNYLGRTFHVGVRALHLHGWSPRAIPRRREVRRLKSTRPK
jgi:hypothetical protein